MVFAFACIQSLSLQVCTHVVGVCVHVRERERERESTNDKFIR